MSASGSDRSRWRLAAPPEHGYDWLTDTHCHLEAQAFAGDRQDVLERARAAGVRRILVPGTDVQSSVRAAALAADEGDVRAAVGVHPHEAVTWSARAERELRQLASRPGIVAIGEIGLDYHYMHSPRQVQRAAFSAQLELAGELGLPVVVHEREALDDLLETLSAWAASSRRGVLHAFGGSLRAADWAAANGWHLGIGGAVTFPASHALRGCLREARCNESVLLETDAPYLAPQARRGRRNEPALVAFVAERLALESGMSVERVVSLARRNAQRLLGWEPE